jgi:hypothetical protein
MVEMGIFGGIFSFNGKLVQRRRLAWPICDSTELRKLWMRFKSHLAKEEIERAADSEDKEVSLCVMALTFVI